MDWSIIDGFTKKEAEMFQHACNHLLGRTFISRIIFEDGVKKSNPEYAFLVRYQQTVQHYLKLIGWDLHHEQYSGYFYVVNDLEENRLSLDKDSTGIILALRLIYDEDSEQAGLYQDVICYVRDLLEKIVTSFSILRQKPNMRDVKKSLQMMENHGIIARLEGKYNEVECRFTILPTILTAVSAEKCNTLVEQLKKMQEETTDEEADEDSIDTLAVL